MGIKLDIVKLNTTKIGEIVTTNVEFDSTAPQPCPILSVTKLTIDGSAQKVAVPFKQGGVYKTSWVPKGQDGWKVNIQATLRVRDDTGYDEIVSWLRVDTGQILYVASNKCNMQGQETDNAAFTKLPKGSLWYIDKITITARKGYLQLADMQMTLYRCWTEATDNGYISY